MERRREEAMEQEEIELVDILRVLWRRRAFIVAGTLLLTVVSLVVTLLLPRVYLVTTLIEPGVRPITNQQGQIVDEKVVVGPESIKASILGGVYDSDIMEKFKIAQSEMPRFDVAIPKDTRIIKISLEVERPDRGVGILKTLVSGISRDVQGKIEVERKLVENEIRQAEMSYQGGLEKVALAKSQMAEAGTVIKTLEMDRKKAMSSRSNDAMAVLLYSNEIQNHQQYLNQLQMELKDLEAAALQDGLKVDSLRQKLAGVKATVIHKAPTIPDKHIKPKKALIVAISCLFGLMGTTLLAFMLEYLNNPKRLKGPLKADPHHLPKEGV